MNFIKSVFLPSVPKGVRIITWATAIRWIGWGFVEYLIPVFLFSFVGSYTETGLLGSIYSIVWLLVIPLIGYIANKISAKHIILMGLLIYPLISISYYLAGALGMVIFIVIARALNGLSFALDETGRDTYIRRHTENKKIATAFGFFETVTSFWWILAVLAGLVLITIFEIHELFLAIIPFTIIAFFMILRMPKDVADKKDIHWKKYFSWKSYSRLIKEIALWGNNLKRLAITDFLSTFIFTVIEFFLPIFIFVQSDGNFQRVIILMLIYSIPGLFGSPLGMFADKLGKTTIPYAFAGIGILLIVLAMTSSFAIQLLAVFIISLLGLLFGLSMSSETTKATDEDHYGSLSSSLSEIGGVSAVIAPIVLGFTIDSAGISYTLIGLGVLSFFLVVLNRK